MIGLSMSAFVYAIHQEEWYVATFISALLVILLLFELYYLLTRTNRDLNNFLLSIKHFDFTKTYPLKIPDKSFKDLHQTFNDIIELYRNVRIEKEVQYQYLQNVLNHINVAIICFRDDHSIELFNKAAGRLLHINFPNNLEKLKEVDPDLFNLVNKLETGENKLIKSVLNGELLHLSVYATEFKLKDVHYKLVSLQNIKNELEEQELESWQKLIRVLTHEIMNSVTPVSSLSTAINEMLVDEKGQKKDLKKIEPDDMKDMYDSLQTIEERSKSLLNFISSYKNLSRLPQPNFQHLRVSDIFQHISQLMKKVLDKANILLEIKIIPSDLSIYADKDMIQQVLINLIVNAKDALQGIKKKKIRLLSFRRNSKVILQVVDNGPGIEKENIDKIFIPFFTTKKKGSGIGLSLARQIMRLHKGSIYFQTVEKEGTVFVLEF